MAKDKKTLEDLVEIKSLENLEDKNVSIKPVMLRPTVTENFKVGQLVEILSENNLEINDGFRYTVDSVNKESKTITVSRKGQFLTVPAKRLRKI